MHLVAFSDHHNVWTLQHDTLVAVVKDDLCCVMHRTLCRIARCTALVQARIWNVSKNRWPVDLHDGGRLTVQRSIEQPPPKNLPYATVLILDGPLPGSHPSAGDVSDYPLCTGLQHGIGSNRMGTAETRRAPSTTKQAYSVHATGMCTSGVVRVFYEQR